MEVVRTAKVAAIVQARTGSTRLPGKVLRDIAGKTMIEQMLLRLERSKMLDETIVAVPRGPEDNRLAKLILDLGKVLFRGSQYDVLSRYYEAAELYDIHIIVRLTADCPLIDPRIVDRVIEAHLKSRADYTSNTLRQTFPRGLDIEVFSFEALERSYFDAHETYQREHVTPYIYLHPYIFVLNGVNARGKLQRPDLRLTVDTTEDLALIRSIYEALGRDGNFFETEQIIDFLDANTELAQLNANIRQKGLEE